ncbi:MAG: B12-binding domain-containing radical SAM protein [Candidatus Helarchaeota archaeon]|nr:B12-binding domain-containing radical SAM protein [Candidatus Helarchaeota archaeon]
MTIPDQGKKIILTGAITDMSSYGDNPVAPFFSGAISNRAFFLSWLLSIPPVPSHEDGRAISAPYGLRKIEAALINSGIDKTDIVTIHPRYLKRFLGPDTKVIAISSMNPLGMTYCDRTFTALVGFGDESRNAYAFRQLLHSKILHKYNPKIIIGGAGAWQVRGQKMRDYFHIDHVVIGEGEVTFPQVAKKILQNEPVPPVIEAVAPKTDDEIPLIQNGAIFGTVEISRGCGRGCKFCTPNRRRRRDFSIERVVREVEINVRARAKIVFTATEDALLYGCRDPKFIPNEEAVLDLYEAIGKVKGVYYIMPAHISLAAVNAAPHLIPRLSEIFDSIAPNLTQDYTRKGLINLHNRFYGAETGIESGSPRIIEKYMPGKVLPFSSKEWPEIVLQACGILNDSNWLPLASMMVGMPGETDDDTLESIELVDRFKKTIRIFLIPVFFTPLGDSRLWGKRAANLNRCTELQQEFFVRCWDYNLKTYADQWAKFPPAKAGLPFFGGLLYNLYYRWKPHNTLYRELINRVCKLR